MLVSPTEPAALRASRTVSSRPEQMGVDFLWSADGVWFGAQRKAIPDLLASAQDGRLSKELAQMKPRIAAGSFRAVLIVEGVVQWTNTGEMLGSTHGRSWSRSSWLGLLWSVRDAGVWVEHSKSVADTSAVLDMLEAWSLKEKHSTAERRPGPVVAWGKAGNRDWQVHFLQGLPGVGAETAKAILDAVGMPFGWRVGREDVLRVKGVGKKTVAAMEAAVPREE